jgi:hypothetical protein
VSLDKGRFLTGDRGQYVKGSSSSSSSGSGPNHSSAVSGIMVEEANLDPPRKASPVVPGAFPSSSHLTGRRTQTISTEHSLHMLGPQWEKEERRPGPDS